MHVPCPHCQYSIDVLSDMSLQEILCPSCGISFNLLSGETTQTLQTETRRLAHFELVRELGIGKFGVNGSDLKSATVTGNLVVRCGGNGYQQQQGALHIGNGGDGQGVGTVANAIVTDNTVRDVLVQASADAAARHTWPAVATQTLAAYTAATATTLAIRRIIVTDNRCSIQHPAANANPGNAGRR